MKRLILLLSLAFLPLLAQAQNKIDVNVHKVVKENESFAVSFSIETDKTVEEFVWKPAGDVKSYHGPSKGYSTSTSTINNKTTTSSKRTFTYRVVAGSAGKITIPAASAKINGRTIYSSPVEIEVVASPSQSSSQSSSQTGAQQDESNALFIEAKVDRSKVVVGEPVTITFKLFSKVSILSFDGFYPPSFTDFKAQELPRSNNVEFDRELYNGEIYEVAELKKYRLYPQRQGKLSISPAELICTISNRMGWYHARATSKEVTVTVSDLPANAPESFGEGIGVFSMSARLSSDVLNAHEVGSLFITISGQGNVAFLEAPKVTFHPDMEVYDVKAEEKSSDSSLSGSKTFEYPFIPRSHGEYVIGPIEYSYYDVNSQKYVTLTAPAMTLTVEKGADLAASGPAMVVGPHRKVVENLGNDIRFINLDEPGLSKKGDFFVQSPVFWIVSILILLSGLVVWLVLKKLLARRSDVVGMKKRKATKMAFKRLSLAESFLKQNLHSAFYEELHKALLGYVANKLNMPMADLSRERITEALSERNVSADVIEQYVALLDACEFARYAPETSNVEMTAHYQSALEVISAIDSDIKTTRKMKSIYVWALLLLLPFSASAQSDADALWNDANNAYLEGRWEEAVKDYEKISRMGLESATLYCNLGNAYFKTDNIAKAILNYERALKLDPSYEDARHNLELSNSMVQDKIESVPEFFLTGWMRDISHLMSSDAWAILFLVLLLLTVALVLLFVFSTVPATRVIAFCAGVLLLVFSIASLSFSIWLKSEYEVADSAIITSPVVSAKASPSDNSSQDLFILHEGTKVKVIEKVGSWSNIELNDGRQGWLPSSDIEVI